MNIETLWLAICIVESACSPTAMNGGEKAYGIAQIRPIMIRDYNKNNGAKLVHEDAFSPTVSKAIFEWYAGHYCTIKRLGHEPTMEDVARNWCGGPNGYKKGATLKYWGKVSKELDKRSEA